MTEPSRERNVAARIITAELQRCLARDPAAAPSRTHAWAATIREWPGRVTPANEAQIHAAVLTLISRTLWPTGHLKDLIALFTPLFQADWCLDAIIHMLDRDPDGGRARPWHAGDGTRSTGPALLTYLETRLHRWRSASGDTTRSPAAPLTSTPFAAWAARMQTVYGDRNTTTRSPLSRAISATEQAGEQHRVPRRDAPLDRVRARTARHEHVAADLRKLGGVLPDEDLQGVLPPDPDLVLLAVPDVHQALVDLAGAATPGRRHADRLRGAIRQARIEQAGEKLLASGKITHDDVMRLATAIVHPDGTRPSEMALKNLIRRFW